MSHMKLPEERLVMEWMMFFFMIVNFVSGVNAEYCKSSGKPKVQVCKQGTVSGTSVYIENRETPTAVNCTCDVKMGGETVNSVRYSGPGYSPCGIQFILGDGLSLSCHHNYKENVSLFTTIEYFKTSDVDEYACLHINLVGNNATITCHEPPSTTPTPRSTILSTVPLTTASTLLDSTDMTTSTLNTAITETTTSAATTTSTTHTTSAATATPVVDPTKTNLPTTTSKGQDNMVTPTTEPSSDPVIGLSQTIIVGMTAGGGGVFLMILVIVVVCCVRKRTCKTPTENDVITENDMYCTNSSIDGSRPTRYFPIRYDSNAHEMTVKTIPGGLNKTDCPHEDPPDHYNTLDGN